MVDAQMLKRKYRMDRVRAAYRCGEVFVISTQWQRLIKIVKEPKLAKNWRFGVAMLTAFGERLDTQAAPAAAAAFRSRRVRRYVSSKKEARTTDQLPPAD